MDPQPRHHSRLVEPVVQWADASAVTCARLGRRGAAPTLLTAAEHQSVLTVWRFERQQAVPMARLLGLSAPASSCAFDSAEDCCLAGSPSGSVKIWSLRTEQVHTALPNAHRTSVTVIESDQNSPHCFVTGSMDTTVKWWDQRDTRQAQSVLKGVHQDAVSALAVSSECKMLLSGDESGLLKFVDLRKWRCLPPCPSQGDSADRLSGAVSCVRFHPLEVAAFAGSSNGAMCGMDFEQTLKRRCSLTASPAGRRIWSVEVVPLDSGADCVITSDQDALRVWKDGSPVYDESVEWCGSVIDSTLLESSAGLHVMQVAAARSHLSLFRLDTSAVTSPGGRAPVPPPQCHAPTPAAPEPAFAASPLTSAARANGLRRGSDADIRRPVAQSTAVTSCIGVPCFPTPATRSKRCNSELIKHGGSGPLIQHTDDSPLHLDFGAWLSHRRADGESERYGGGVPQQSSQMRALLQRRLQNLRAVRSLWDRGDRQNALAYCLQRTGEGDVSVGVDVLVLLTSSQRAKELLTQDHCTLLLRTAAAVLRDNSATDGACGSSIRACRSLSRRFLAAAERASGGVQNRAVDLAAEDRKGRAEDCMRAFRDLAGAVKTLSGCTPQVREEAQLLLRELGQG